MLGVVFFEVGVWFVWFWVVGGGWLGVFVVVFSVGFGRRKLVFIVGFVFVFLFVRFCLCLMVILFYE